MCWQSSPLSPVFLPRNSKLASFMVQQGHEQMLHGEFHQPCAVWEKSIEYQSWGRQPRQLSATITFASVNLSKPRCDLASVQNWTVKPFCCYRSGFRWSCELQDKQVYYFIGIHRTNYLYQYSCGASQVMSWPVCPRIPQSTEGICCQERLPLDHCEW